MTINLEKVDRYIYDFVELLHEPKQLTHDGKLKVGVDLGTSNIVISVLTEENIPVAGSFCPASVVRDGFVVDYVGAVGIVKKLKAGLEKRLGITLTEAAGAVPPGTVGGNRKTIQNVLESAFFEVTNIVDEPTAAASVLGIKKGVVVDVGGGTTGISILRDGEVIYTADEPTGGTHMSLVLSGYYHISFEEAEQLKTNREREEEVFSLIRPVVEKMALIVEKHIQGYSVDHIYLVGGASSFTKFADVFREQIGIETVRPDHPLFITPLGIAMNC